MLHILLFKTVKSEYLDFCIDTCRDHFANALIVLISQKEPSLSAFAAKVDRLVMVKDGMLSPASITDDVKNELPQDVQCIAVIPIYNPDFDYYRGVWSAASLAGASKVFGLSLDGRFARLTRLGFIGRRIFGSRPVRIATTVLIAPYAIWLFIKNRVRFKINNSFDQAR